MWIPSHVGLEGNDRVDSAAKSSLHQTRLQPIKPSISQIKNRAKITAKQITLIQHQVWVQAGSPSATWYKTVTEYETITIPRSMSRKDAVIIHRLRLGYPCSWEIDERVPKECNHCQTVVSHPLTHYLLDCQALYHIRPHNFRDVPDIETSQRSSNLCPHHTRIRGIFPNPWCGASMPRDSRAGGDALVDFMMPGKNAAMRGLRGV